MTSTTTSNNTPYICADCGRRITAWANEKIGPFGTQGRCVRCFDRKGNTPLDARPVGPDVTVRVTPAVAADWSSRDVFTEYATTGTHQVPCDVAAEMAADATYQADPEGPGQSLTFGMRSAYLKLAAQLRP